MRLLQHLVEPERLWVTWQCPEDNQPRDRRIVAEVVRQEGSCRFVYLTESDDYKRAVETGFPGYSAFDMSQPVHDVGVMDVLARRLPPRKREDFSDYLLQFRLPASFSGSNFALLGYTAGKLPSDTFGFVPDFRGIALPVDMLLEVAGFRYQAANHLPEIGCSVQFSLEPDNEAESNAVAIMCEGKRLGYVNRALRAWVADCLMENRTVFGEVARLNGKPERQLVYIYCMID